MTVGREPDWHWVGVYDQKDRQNETDRMRRTRRYINLYWQKETKNKVCSGYAVLTTIRKLWFNEQHYWIIVYPVSWGHRINTLTVTLLRGMPPLQWVFWLWGSSNARALGNAGYPFIAQVQKSFQSKLKWTSSPPPPLSNELLTSHLDVITLIRVWSFVPIPLRALCRQLAKNSGRLREQVTRRENKTNKQGF